MKKGIKTAIDALFCVAVAIIFGAATTLIMMIGGADFESTIFWALLNGIGLSALAYFSK